MKAKNYGKVCRDADNYDFSQEKNPKHDSHTTSEDSRLRDQTQGQAKKSARGMPWHWEPKKGVAIYEKPRLAESRRLTRGCPNGETRPESSPVTIH